MPRFFDALCAALMSVSLVACKGGARDATIQDDTSLLGPVGASITNGHGLSGVHAALPGRATRKPNGYSEIGTSSPSSERGVAQATGDASGKNVTLNFVETEVQEFVRVVFDEVLHESAIVDPSVSGRITVRTVQPISKSAAIDLVRNVLQMNGASLTKTGSIYRVERSGDSAGRGRPDGVVRAFPLRHIDGDQAKSAIQALAGNKLELFAGKGSRFVVVSGGAGDLGAVEEILASLDIDQMAGTSFALAPLKEGSAQAVANELMQMFGQGGQLKTIVVQRINAVLLIAQTPSILERARNWIGRLDQGGQDERKVFVHPVQNRRAQDLAKILNGMMGSGASDPARLQSAVAPVAKLAMAGSGDLPPPRPSAAMAMTDGPVGGGGDIADPGLFSRGPAGGNPFSQGNIGISADPSTNSLVVIAKPDEFRLVEAAIRRLDVQPAQVLIEATIFEVRLNDTLRHGVRWFFEHGNHGALLTDSGSGSTGPVYPGFHYIFQIPKARVILNALEGMTKLEVISSPALTVLDNQTATLKVGDQVPIATRSAQSVATPGAPLVNDIQLKDTGIILSVTPRVNAGGLVQLDISQEVSDVVQTTSSSIDSPTIRQRSVNSSVAVQSGTEIVLGGLISRRGESGHVGIPLLKDIPVVGEAFSSNIFQVKDRSELLIIIRPVVMSTQSDVYAVTQEIKSRMRDSGNWRTPRPIVAKN